MLSSNSERYQTPEYDLFMSQNSESRRHLSTMEEEIVLNEAAILKVINDLRGKMNLTLLERNRTLRKYASAISNRENKTLTWGNDKYALISVNALSKEYCYMSAEELVKKWIYNSEYRNVILSPGNYGAVNIEKVKENRCVITFVAAYIFRN